MNDELLTVGAAFRGYRVLRRIGVGGTGEVYLARHETMGVDHAVKVIDRRQVEGDAEFNVRFLREVRIAARLRHPALVAVHDAGQDEVTGLYFVAMDYLPGGTVADELAKLHRFSIAKALGIARTVAEGLSALEAAGVVHRDVKPSNMLIAALDPASGARDLERAAAKSPEVRILKLADGKGVLAAYFRVRREAYRKRKLSLAMTKHDFAAVLSLACGGSIFPHLRRYGLKVDEFATDIKIYGLPTAAFFGE